MAKWKKLKKIGGDKEVQKLSVGSLELIIGKQNVVTLESGFGEQNVVPSELGLGEQNVAPSKSKIDESSNLCGLELAMMIVYNLNDEVPPNTY